MFRCHFCEKVIGPKISPVLLTVSERPAVYINTDEDGKEVETFGREIVEQVKLCHSCAKVPAPPARTFVECDHKMSEPMTPTSKVSLCRFVVDSMMDNTLSNTKRGQASVKAAIKVLKPYEERGGTL